MSSEKRDFKKFSPEETAQILFKEQWGERKKLWQSIIADSELNDENQEIFFQILETDFTENKYSVVSSFLDNLKARLWNAGVYSYQTNAAVSIYDNLRADIEAFKKELYSQ